MEESSFYLLGFKFTELGNFITDIIMAIASYTFYIKLKNDKDNLYFSYFFLFMAISSFLGGFGHLLYNYTEKPFQIFGWFFSSLSVYFIEYAAIKELKSKKIKKRLNILINIQFLLFTIFALTFQEFIVVTISTIVGLMGIVIPILGIQAFHKNKKRNILIISGILLSGIPAFLYKLNGDIIGLSGKELSHLILVLCFYIIFIGVNTSTVKEKAVNSL